MVWQFIQHLKAAARSVDDGPPFGVEAGVDERRETWLILRIAADLAQTPKQRFGVESRAFTQAFQRTTIPTDVAQRRTQFKHMMIGISFWDPKQLSCSLRLTCSARKIAPARRPTRPCSSLSLDPILKSSGTLQLAFKLP